MFNKFTFPFTLIGLVVNTAVHAESGSDESGNRLEQVTVIGEKSTEGAHLGGVNLIDLPLSAFVMRRDEIERIRFVDPDDILDRIPGETQVRNLRIPNGGKPYTIPLVDGMPLADPYGGATSQISRVNSFDIERIEIIKGPASALYGNNAFGGVINVVTRDVPKEQEYRAWFELGEFGHRRTGMSSIGSIGDKIAYVLDANMLKSDGLRDNYAPVNPSGFPDAVKNDRDALSGKLDYQIAENTELTARYEYLKRDETTATDIPQSQFDRDKTLILSNRSGNPDVSFEKAISQALYLKAIHEADSGEINVSAVVRKVEVEGDGRFSNPKIESQDSISSKLWYRHDFSNSNLIIGGENYSGNVNTHFYSGADLHFTGSVVNHAETDLNITALFAQYSVSPMDALNITVGVRLEDIRADSLLGSSDFDDVAPKLGVSYQMNDNNMIWLGLSEGFLAPSPEDLFDPIEGNPNLKPEDAQNIEFGVRGSAGKLSYSSAYYHTRIQNYLFTQEVDANNDGELDADQTSNAAQVTVQGLESVIEYSLTDHWRFSMTHTYAKNRFDSFVQSVAGADDDFSGHSLSRSPQHHVNARVAWLPLDGLIVELESDFYSSYTTSDASDDPQGNFKRAERVDLRVNYAFGNWVVWLNGLNLSDTLEDRVSYSSRRGERSYRLVDGRSFQTGVSYTF